MIENKTKEKWGVTLLTMLIVLVMGTISYLALGYQTPNDDQILEAQTAESKKAESGEPEEISLVSTNNGIENGIAKRAITNSGSIILVSAVLSEENERSYTAQVVNDLTGERRTIGELSKSDGEHFLIYQTSDNLTYFKKVVVLVNEEKEGDEREILAGTF